MRTSCDCCATSWAFRSPEVLILTAAVARAIGAITRLRPIARSRVTSLDPETGSSRLLPGRWQFALAALLLFLVVLNRSSLGVAGQFAESRFGIGPGELSAFVMLQFGIYAALQVPAGAVVDRFGPRRTLVTAGILTGTAQLRFGRLPGDGARLHRSGTDASGVWPAEPEHLPSRTRCHGARSSHGGHPHQSVAPARQRTNEKQALRGWASIHDNLGCGLVGRAPERAWLAKDQSGGTASDAGCAPRVNT